MGSIDRLSARSPRVRRFALRLGRLLGLLALVLCPASLQAGLYNPAEPHEGPLDPDFRKFSETLTRLRSIGMEGVQVDNPLRMRYFLIADSAPRVIPSTWPLDRKISLSAYLIRRQKYQEAIELLKPLARREGNNFLILSNLATAYQLSGQEPGLAIDYLNQTIRVWPDSWDKVPKDIEPMLTALGWTKSSKGSLRDSLTWFHKAETYQVKLLMSRARQRAAGGTKAKIPEKLDDLFDVHFVGESGKYEAGKLAAKEMAKLPADALAIVQQLLVWLPDDPRLYWLLGELYNARGEIETAARIFDELAGYNGRFRAAELVNHWRILRAAPPAAPPEDNLPPDLDKTKPSPTPERVVYLDVRALLVGFGTGIVFSLMGYWQLREILRRRQGKAKA